MIAALRRRLNGRAASAAGPPRAAAPSAGLGARRVIGLRVSAIVETVGFLAIAVLIDALMLDGSRFWNVEPHPFWVLVALIAVQYGTNEGVFAALCASVVLLSGRIPVQSIDTDFYAYVLNIGARPLLWITSAVILGEIRNRHGRREAELETKLAESERREQGIALAYQELKAAHEKLELSVASELKTVVTIYRAARHLQNLSVNEVMAGAVNLVNVVLAPQKFSLFTLERGSLTLTIKRGWTDDDSYETTIWPDSPLFQAVAIGQRYVTIADPVDERVLARQGMIAGPLLRGEGGEVAGMLKIERLGFADLNLTAVENFKVVCELLSTALGNVKRYDDAYAQSIVASDSMLLSDAFYARQAAFLAALARRIGFPVSIMRVAFDEAERLEEERRARISGAVRDASVQVLRATDLAFEFRSGRWEYVIVLPNTPIESTPIVAEKFRAAVLAKVGAPELAIRVECEPLVEAGETEAPAHTVPAVEEYARQTQFLLALARRAGFAISAVRLAVNVQLQLPATLRAKLPAALLAAVRETLEPSDLAFSLERSGMTIAVLLPGLGLEAAQAKGEIMRNAVADKLGGASGAVAIAVHAEDLTPGSAMPAARPPRGEPAPADTPSGRRRSAEAIHGE